MECARESAPDSGAPVGISSISPWEQKPNSGRQNARKDGAQRAPRIETDQGVANYPGAEAKPQTQARNQWAGAGPPGGTRSKGRG